MNPALSHWYPSPPSQDDEDEFYDPFENGADTWNWEIHMCLIFYDMFMIVLELNICLSLWDFTKHDENTDVVQATQVVFARLLLMNELRVTQTVTETHYNKIPDSFNESSLLPLLGKIMCFKLVELTTYIVLTSVGRRYKICSGHKLKNTQLSADQNSATTRWQAEENDVFVGFRWQSLNYIQLLYYIS